MSKSHWSIFSSIVCWPGASSGFGPATEWERARTTEKWRIDFLPRHLLTPAVMCCSMTPGARMLKRTSDSGIGCFAYA
jgi:hypothetical protein